MRLSIAIAGATGAVGTDLIRLLESGRIPVGELRLLASPASAGKRIRFGGKELEVEPLTAESFRGIDLAFFSAGSARSREFAPAAVAAGAVVVDNSSAFRMDPDVPLVVPEINPKALRPDARIVAVPNCTTIVALMGAAPLFTAAGAVELRVASYQAASGAGAKAMRELIDQNRAVAAGEVPRAEAFPHVLAGNVIPHVGGFLDDGETEEERKMRDESRKILGAPDLRVSATCVRVPVLRAHCTAVWITTREPLSPERAREILAAAPGVKLLDEPKAAAYPMPILAAETAPVLVGRIRTDHAAAGNGLMFFAAGDQLLKGAALNAVQIAEELIAEGHLPCRPSRPPTSSRE